MKDAGAADRARSHPFSRGSPSRRIALLCAGVACLASPLAARGGDMVLVGEGPFLMGSAVGERDEAPPHTVLLDAFEIDRTEVTNSAYLLFWKEDGGIESPHTPASFEGNPGLLWPAVVRDRPDHPVVGVTWFDAEAYCRWAGKRLPTEAEWEKAARGDDGRTWPWGTGHPKDAVQANLSGRGATPCTASVGSFPLGASPCGAQDMAGNVWEWVADWYGPYGASRRSVRNPRGPSRGGVRTLRGGSWKTSRAFARTTYRNSSFLPTEHMPDIGFRCARDAKG